MHKEKFYSFMIMTPIQCLLIVFLIVVKKLVLIHIYIDICMHVCIFISERIIINFIIL